MTLLGIPRAGCAAGPPRRGALDNGRPAGMAHAGLGCGAPGDPRPRAWPRSPGPPPRRPAAKFGPGRVRGGGVRRRSAARWARGGGRRRGLGRAPAPGHLLESRRPGRVAAAGGDLWTLGTRLVALLAPPPASRSWSGRSCAPRCCGGLLEGLGSPSMAQCAAGGGRGMLEGEERRGAFSVPVCVPPWGLSWVLSLREG